MATLSAVIPTFGGRPFRPVSAARPWSGRDGGER